MTTDLRTAFRTLLRDRGYATVAVLTLAFGVAVNTIIFSIVDGILLRPLSYRDSGQIVMINEIVPEVMKMYPKLPANALHFFEWRKQCASFQDMSLIDPKDFVLTRAGEPEQLRGARVSANLLGMLGVQPQIGRPFVAEDDQPGHDRVVIISDRLWERRFHRDQAIIGHNITLDGFAYTVVGVLPANFRFPKGRRGELTNFPRNADVFKPIAFSVPDLEWVGEFNYTVFARLKPGASIRQAAAELEVVQASIENRINHEMHLKASIVPLQEAVTGPARQGLWILFAAVGAVLLIACVNLANLALARSTAHARDLAIRTALGAGRARLIRYVLAENLWLAILGGIAGAGLGWAGLKIILMNAPLDLPRLDEIHLDGRALLFAFGLSLFSGLLFGILPALRAASADPQTALRAGSRTSTDARQGIVTRDLLVGFEAALSAVLLIVAGLLIVSFLKLLNTDKGFNADRLMTMEITLPSSSYPEEKQRDLYFQALVPRLSALPGVTSAGLISRLPLEGEDWIDLITKPGDQRPLFQLPTANFRFCSPGYFKTMGISFVAGGPFTEADRRRHTAILGERAARDLWPNENPIGKAFRRANPDEAPFEVVGVVRDISVELGKDAVRTVYTPYWYRNRLSMTAVVRTSGDPRALANSVRQAVWQQDPDTVVGDIRTMQGVVSDSVGQRRFQVSLMIGFALSALSLACIGIYGVVAWSVARRRNEIGIRMALGANRIDVHRMILGQAMRPVLAGLLAGIAGALALGHILNTLLFGVTARSPLIIALVGCVLLLVSAMACYVPAHRATAADPVEALRYE